MNNKGFTLVELLAVIVILLGIAAVSIYNISASLRRNDEQECERQGEILKNAAKIYFSLNEGSTSVSASILDSQGYLNKEDITLYEGATINSNYNISGSATCS